MDTRPLLDRSASDFVAELEAKVSGSVALDAATADEPLELFALFSSISSLVGDFGQCAYAAANRFLDAFAEQREAARARKDWATADAIRDQLNQSGLVIEDSPDGPRWTLGPR